jgi:hypothetical protein
MASQLAEALFSLGGRGFSPGARTSKTNGLQPLKKSFSVFFRSLFSHAVTLA